MKKTIKIGKRGGGLAFRLPKALVEKFDLKVGDSIDEKYIVQMIVGSRKMLETNQK